ncbi:hypothetical protein R2601_14685 [Salipiger bermudensis HTCC2601]|uniref:Uncharacterized protein n=1 Tax=Salipiger bermudensis (strain DSM 26914 / JCM 13377 / KCTC 12554 / HTCC2601) TaxID=314265 RepID=Q0FVA5_SALBH|nr:hypothetical protein R2601_14685 [Salipiger bermudensis HTCC2601]
MSKPASRPASAVHRVEEFRVRLGLLELRKQELDGVGGAHRVEDPTQHEGLLQIDLVDEQILFAGARLEDVDRREDALVRDLAIQHDLRVAGALEFFEDHLVHAAAGVDQGGRDDGQRATFLDVPRRAEETLRALQRVGIDTTGQNLARRRHDSVEGTAKSCDRVKKYHNISFVFHKALGLFDDHFRHCHVARRRFIEGRGDNLALHRPLHVGDFLGAFVDQQDDQEALGMVFLDRGGDVLQQNRLTGPRRRHDQRALALPDRRHEVDDPGGAILDGRILDLHLQPLIWIERRQVIEGNLVTGALGIFEVDLRDINQSEVALFVVWRANFAFDGVAGAQRVLPDHLRRHVDVVGTGQIVRFRRAQEAKTVLEHLENPVTGHFPAFIRPLAQDLEHHLALAHGRGVLDLELLGHREQILGALRLEVREVERFAAHAESFRAKRIRRPQNCLSLGSDQPGRASDSDLAIAAR